MQEFIKMGILYIVLISTMLYATNYYKKIFNFLTNSKKEYIEYMEDITEDKIENRQTHRFTSLGVGL